MRTPLKPELLDADAMSSARTEMSAWRNKGSSLGALAAKLFFVFAHAQRIDRRLAALEARVAESGDGKSLADSYCGVWREGQRYERGAVVTHSGSAWLALGDADSERPGDGPSWRLFVKRGRNARDAS